MLIIDKERKMISKNQVKVPWRMIIDSKGWRFVKASEMVRVYAHNITMLEYKRASM